MTDPAPSAADRLTRAWQSLAKADELVQGFGERGWIADTTLAVVTQQAHDLARRVGRHDQARSRPGGEVEDPTVLAGEVDRLTAVLVALVDEAVAAQPSLAPQVPVPVSLEDAQRRLAATHDAYDAPDDLA